MNLSPKEGVGNAGCPLHPRPRVHLVVVERTRVTTSTPESPGIPARNGFNSLCRALPGDRALLPPSSADRFCLSPVGPTQLRELDTSVGASGPHDFAVRSNISRQHAGDRSQVFRPALRSHCAQNAAASTASLPYVCDDHDTPLLWGGMREVLEMIWGVRKQKYFCKRDWTTQISLRKHNKSPRTRNDIDGYRFRPTHAKRCPTGQSPLSRERTRLVSRTRSSASWRCSASGTIDPGLQRTTPP